MTFMVQDLLDYAQIKSNKFRKNITKFNLRDAVEQVMSVQRQKAEEQGLLFYATFEGETNIISDESRIMQVLLGLQTNAIKFT